jgi:hypothetical protein
VLSVPLICWMINNATTSGGVRLVAWRYIQYTDQSRSSMRSAEHVRRSVDGLASRVRPGPERDPEGEFVPSVGLLRGLQLIDLSILSGPRRR